MERRPLRTSGWQCGTAAARTVWTYPPTPGKQTWRQCFTMFRMEKTLLLVILSITRGKRLLTKRLHSLRTPLLIRVGTRRYMAPEILNSTINTACFQSFKAADVYCLGLVMWEVARRTVAANEKPVFQQPANEKPVFPSQYQLSANEKAGVEDRELPYYDVVPADPSHQDMLQVILICDWSIDQNTEL